MPVHPMKPGTYEVSSGYGPRWGAFHAGLDFAAPIGTPIYAAADGVVVEGRDRTGVAGFGSWIWLDCQQSAGVDLIYGHVKHDGILVTAGDRVRAGQQIGVVGNEGESTGPHLHFEVWGPPGRVGGAHRDPAVWLRAATPPTTTPAAPPVKGPTMPPVIDWTSRFDFGEPRPTSAISGICIHVTVNAPGTPCEYVAQYQISSQSGSYHELVDTTGKVLVENTDDWLTWSAGPTSNARHLHRSFVMRGTESRDQWLAQDVMLRAAAQRDAAWAKRYGIPIVRLSAADLRAGKRGFFGHDTTAQAWSETDHVDPGPGFPWDRYLQLVSEYANPSAAPAAPTKGTDDMSFTDDDRRKLNEVWDQLRGPQGKGWSQLGQTAAGLSLTLVDAIAALRKDIAALTAKIGGQR